MYKIKTSPDHNNTGWPPGVKYIIGNEGSERFSYYGMKAILWVYLSYLYTQVGYEHSQDLATEHLHIFSAAVYGMGLIGAVLAEKLLGKYKTILYLSLVYCAGHAALSIFEDHVLGVYFGLALIAIGSGGIKPCVSAHVGDQFGRGNWHLIPKVFQAFYFIINFGSFFATLSIPYVKEHYGYSIAFAIPGILMAIATLFFWMGRKVFVHIPGNPGGKLGAMDAAIGILLSFALLIPLIIMESFKLSPMLASILTIGCFVLGLLIFVKRQSIQEENGFLAVVLTSLGFGKVQRKLEAPKYGNHWFFKRAAEFGDDAIVGPAAVFKIFAVFIFVSVFWSLFDQNGSSWIRQAADMDRLVTLGSFSFTILPEQVQALNPIMVMCLIPLTSMFFYPAIEKLGFEMTPLRRMGLGMFIAAVSFVIVAIAQERIEAGHTVSIMWQVVAFLVLTLAEVMVSVTGLEFAYTQAPKSMKSVIMGIWLLTVSLGNVLTAAMFHTFSGMDLSLSFWVFSAMMAAAAMLFSISSMFYTYQDFTQD